MRMRQSLAELEQAFVRELAVDRELRERALHAANVRQRARHLERAHKHGTVRFFVLCLVLLATAVLVTVAMFETLYFVMG